MIKYRPANKYDTEKIAHLHARNWQLNYKGIFTDEYLNYYVMDDRLAVWKKRLDEQDENRHIVIAEEENDMVGFACTYLNSDPQWGALLDNLHVTTNWKGKGIGRELMCRSAKWVSEKASTSNYHLWVLKKNTPAIQFYEKLGGKQQELISEEMPDGRIAQVFRYIWTDINILMGK